MKIKVFLSFFLGIVTFTLFIFNLPASASAVTRYNLLLITIDTLRPDRLSCYDSSHLKTPNIDRLAANGVVFTRAFAHTPLTLPSHANILLGLTPLRHGVHDNGFFKVPPELPNMATYLKSNGYSCGAFIGAFPLDSRFGLNQGFEVYDQNYGAGTGLDFKFTERKAEAVVKSAMDWLKNQKQPWFAWIHCFDPHQPYEPPEPFATQYKNDPYSGEVAYVDASLAPLLDYLQKTNQLGQSVIVLTGDHGQSLGEHGETTHGYFTYNSTLWVPLIITAPGLKPQKIGENVCHIDIFPTVCDLLGLKTPDYLEGLSLVPIIKGKSLPSRKIYFESLYAYYRRGWAPLRGFIEGNKKFIDSPIPELYDLKSDFQENKNIATASISREKEALNELIKKESAFKLEARYRPDAAAKEKLQSLGYVGGYQPPEKKVFGPEDDLKTLLPFNHQFELAQEFYFQGKVAESVRLLKDLITKRPEFDNPYLFLVTIYEKSKNLSEAEKILKAGTEANPRNYKLWMEYGLVLVEEGNYDQALVSLNKALGLVDWDPDLWNYLGVAYWKSGQPEKAIEVYEKALALDPAYPVVLTNLATSEMSLALKNRDRQILTSAEEHFKKAIELDPEHAEAYNGLGAVYRIQGNIDGAIFNWNRTLTIVPDHRYALYNLALAYLDTGKKEQALAYLNKYKQLYGHSLSDKEKAELETLIEKCR
ncbi:MAG: sulfatase-like hydrolase/transferase [Candidatus Saccharicenans sp.]|nr:MAG: hypothetical protein C0168_03905 [Candidatus Aminicenantes bacterium]HEK86236.1 tetratricopeptide repeat protein [Candidatus Aminicenantes bacterium]